MATDAVPTRLGDLPSLPEVHASLAVSAMSVDLFEMADYVLDHVGRHNNHGLPHDDKTLIVAEIK